MNDFVGERLCPGIRYQRTNEFTDYLIGDQFGACQLLNGWAILMFNRDDIPESFVHNLQPKKRVVLVDVEDHVMCSRFILFRSERKLCEVSHNGQDCDVMDLKKVGRLPSGGSQIVKDQYKKQQDSAEDDVDYVYDIPFELGKLIVGYRHDQVEQCPVHEAGFEFFSAERLS